MKDEKNEEVFCLRSYAKVELAMLYAPGLCATPLFFLIRETKVRCYVHLTKSDHQRPDFVEKLFTSTFSVQEKHGANVGTVPQAPNW